jgi:hypothetical protein
MSQIEDKLSHDERLRLECLAQAVQLASAKAMSRSGSIVSGESVIRDTEAFVKVISDAPFKVTNVPE